jgi:diguanylate cyclase (GGDEF)-like protein
VLPAQTVKRAIYDRVLRNTHSDRKQQSYMTSDRNHTAASLPLPVEAPVALALALERIRRWQTTRESTAKCRKCADDLHVITEILAEGIGEMKEQTKIALVKSHKALANIESALVTAEEEKNEAQLRALHDSATGLPNRDLFDDRLAHAIALAKRHDWTLAVMFLDLDRFKCINDAHGHAAGDGVLKEVAKRLLEHSRAEDTVCRNGGDEFLYLLMNPQGSKNIERIAGALLRTIAQPIDMGHLQLVIKASIGIAVYPCNGTTEEQLIRNADTAMYRAKQRMNGCVFFNVLDTEGTSGKSPGLRS